MTQERTYVDARSCGYHGDLLPAIHRALRPLPPGSKILDAGCGNGIVAADLVRQGFSVTGIDISDSGIAYARQNCPAGTFHVASITDPAIHSLPGAPFDAVAAVEVIEHVHSPAQFLEGCRSVLKDRGLLVLTTPYHGYLKNLLLALGNRWDHHLQPDHEGGHIKFWSIRTLVRALGAHGFTVDLVHGIGRFPFAWKSMLVRALKT